MNQPRNQGGLRWGGSFRESVNLMSLSLAGLFFLATVFTIYLARPILLPVVLAGLLALIVRPVHRLLERWHVQRMVAAFLIFAALVGAIAVGSTYLYKPAVKWVETLPGNVRQVEHKLRDLIMPIWKFRQVADQMGEIAEPDKDKRTSRMEIGPTKAGDRVIGYVQEFVTLVVLTFLLMFFMLAYGDVIYEKLAEQVGALELVRDITRQLSKYLFTVTSINAGLGGAIGLGMYLLHMPNPILWGVMGGLLNFIPYLGAIVGVMAVTFAAMLTFDSGWQIAAVPLVYFGLTAIEGNLVTPMILGHRFTINPIIIFIWLITWGWIWGIPGALIAVPLLMAFKIVCDHVPLLNRVGRLMSF